MTLRRAARTGMLLASTTLALAGCLGSLLESDAPAEQTYRLGQSSVASAPAADAGATFALVVVRPRSAPALDTTRIAIAPGGSRFDYYTGARWAEPAPLMLQQQLVAALEASGRYAGVFAAPARSPAELVLDVELRHFEAVAESTEATPTVHVQVQASLVDARRATRVASFVSEARVAATENRRPAIMAAFEAASAQVVGDAVRRLEQAAATVPVKLQ